MLISVPVNTPQPYRLVRWTLDYERLTACRSVALSGEVVICLLAQCGMPNGKRPCVSRASLLVVPRDTILTSGLKLSKRTSWI